MNAMTNVIAFRPRTETPSLRRPRSLIRAAREGQSGWRRERDLPRLLRSNHCPLPGAALSRLRAEEEMQNTARLEHSDQYDMQRHVLLMIAILAEMRAAVAAAPQPVSALISDVLTNAANAILNARGTTTPVHP